jgi:hypothetical protein
MKVVRNIVQRDELTIVALGDIHLGHINCDKSVLNNVIDYIKDNDVYWVGGGDYGDSIVPNDKRFDYRAIDTEFKTPREQYREIEKLFTPIKNKCLGLLDGNHDIIHWKKNSIHNYVEELSERLNVPYLTIDAYLRLMFPSFDNACFDIYTHHGWSGSRTKSSRVKNISDLATVFPYADLYLMFHMHDIGIADKTANLYIDDNMEIRDKLSWFVFGGNFLRGYMKNTVSYVEEKTYRPALLGSPIITIKPRRGKNTVSFDLEYKEIR